ncbi:CDGSH iron-sulfur domain-containing protein [Yoonia sp. 2307UL14-13]|uniref:CDGSH iron-sulfur domain-containing protein n=1 Tax=Yoonia sp. 2307UL14-13 TaxID=3126506 RepID=UPI0030A25819
MSQKGPFPVDVEAGKSYFWCACGRSENQPFCDGPHKATDFAQVKFEAPDSKRVFFWGCKHSAAPVTCDGTLNRL